MELIKHKAESGEHVIVYTAWVRLDTQEVLNKRLSASGIKACILKQSVEPVKREKWVKEKLDEGMQVLITNPFLIQTGLD